MSAEREVDLVIGSWVAGGVVREAPPYAVRAALDEVGRTRQRAPGFSRLLPVWVAPQPWPRDGRSRRELVAMGALLALLTGLAAGTGILIPDRPPLSSDPAPTPSSHPSDAHSVSRLLRFAEDGIELPVPGDWVRAPTEVDGVFQVRGANPSGLLSIYHGHPTMAKICDPTCVSIDLPAFVPFSAERTIDVLANKISAMTGAADWVASSGYHLRLAEARRLDVTGEQGDAPRRIYLIGTYATDVVVAVLVSSDERLRDAAVETLLDGIRFFPRVAENAGVPIIHAEPTLGFSLKMPDSWIETAIDVAPGARAYGDRAHADPDVTVSVPDALGLLTVCDPACRHVFAETLDELEAAAFRRESTALVEGDTTLSDAPARFQRDSTTDSPAYRVVALVDGFPIHLWFDASDPNVDPALFEEITASFRFVRTTPAVRDGNRLIGDGFQLDLSPYWQGNWGEGRPRGIAVDRGDSSGWFWSCDLEGYPTGKLVCAIRQATTLDELMQTAGDTAEVESVTLDGEPAVLTRKLAWESASEGNQWLIRIMTVHDGRPFVIRLHNRLNATFDLEAILAGFRFTD